MAATNAKLISALEDVAGQVAKLNLFLQKNGGLGANVTGGPPRATPSPTFQSQSPNIPSAWTAQATKNADFRPSMPIGAPPRLPNLYPSNPGSVASEVQNIDKEVSNIQQETNLTAASELPNSWYKRYAVGSFNIKRQIQVANQLGNYMSTGYPSTMPLVGGLSQTIGSSISNITNKNGSLQFGNKNITPEAIQVGMMALADNPIVSGLSGLNNWENSRASVGQQFGYGPGPLGNSFLGFQLPQIFGKAARVGTAFTAETNYLDGRNLASIGNGGNLTSAQAQSVTSTLGQQGFSMNPQWNPFTGAPTGDAATIANGFMSPLMSQMPGLSAQSLAPFTSSLRNSGNDVTSLTLALSNLGTESRAAKQTVTQFAASVASAASTLESMGATQANAINTATDFTNATGISPQVGSQLAQNPLIQGLALGQGVLPSGIGNMGAGLASLGVNAVKMMAGMVGNQFHNQWTTVNGVRQMTQNGMAMEDSFIGSQLGISPTQVRRMLGESTRYSHTAQALSLVGQGGTFPAGIEGALEAGNKQMATKAWNADQGVFRQAGIKQSTLNQLGHEGWNARMKNLTGDLARIGGGGEFNKINAAQNQYTIGLTAEARRFFHLHAGQSSAQRSAHAGGTAYRDLLANPAERAALPIHISGRAEALNG